MTGEKIENDDLTICDREPIHKLGRVQSNGFLIALSSNWDISHVSENFRDFISMDLASYLGKPAVDVLGDELIHIVRNRIQTLPGTGGSEVVGNLTAVEMFGERLIDLTISRSEGTTILEFEWSSGSEQVGKKIAEVQQAIARLGRMDTIEKMLAFAVRYCSIATGYDRVMAYRFHSDESGEVVAEVAGPNMDPYLGLRYPATDIPKQARALYIRNAIRIISDTSSNGHGILSPDASTELDLSDSVLRSVSPIHLEYLTNMGVGASMSVSIIVEGKLWGLIACHHNEPKVLPQHERNAMLLFGQMLSMLISQKEAEKNREYQTRVTDIVSGLVGRASEASSVSEALHGADSRLMDLFAADGLAIVESELITSFGTTPNEAEILVLVSELKSKNHNDIFSTHELKQFLPAAEYFQETASGLLAIPISNRPDAFILFFRKGLSQTINWAGNPDKAVNASKDNQRINPRKSFAAWQVVVDGKSLEWTKPEIIAATNLRLIVLDTVLRITGAAAEERQRANEKQEVLIAELNHRVRNILQLVRSLLGQTSRKELSLDDFVKVFEARIQALARAHDQITKVNWSSASLRQLIHAEIEAFLGKNFSRLNYEGEDVSIDPIAFGTLAMVFHELITNSAKYGSLSNMAGTATVKVARLSGDALEITWREDGGPKVEEPKRQGFGTGLVKRSIPFELKGEAEIQFNPEGVFARFMIPNQFIKNWSATDVRKHFEDQHVSQVDDFSGVAGAVLVVEDNLLIAMDLEEMLKGLGYEEVHVCSSVKAALDTIDNNSVAFALLDINLGSETSLGIAERLRTDAIPFIFTSGYGETQILGSEFSGVPVVAKPFDNEILKRSIWSEIAQKKSATE